MSDSYGTGERFEVILHGQDALFRLPCGEQVIATQDSLSKSKVLRHTLHTVQNDSTGFLILPRGYLVSWLHFAKVMSEGTFGEADFAELCQALPTSRIVEGLQVGFKMLYINLCFLDAYLC